MKANSVLNSSLVSLLVFFVIACPSKSYSQEVQDTVIQKNDSLFMKSSFSLGLTRRTGAFSQFVIHPYLESKLKYRRIDFLNKTDYSYANTNGMRLADDWFIISSLEYSFRDSARVCLALFHDFRKNIQYKISRSHKLFSGIRIRPFKQKNNYLVYAGMGYENTWYIGDLFENDLEIDANRRFSSSIIHIKNSHTLLDNSVLFDYDLFYFQSLRMLQDYTFGLFASIKFEIRKALFLGLSYDLRYRNVHLLEVPALNDLLTINLTIDFP